MVGQVQLSVAIIGGGPGGLGAAIALSELPFVQVTLYEKNSEPREAGAGLSLHTNAWNVLDLLGASDGVKGGAKSNIHQRNGYTGEIVTLPKKKENPEAHRRGAIRARRTRLQSALLARVPHGVIQYSKKLISLEIMPAKGVRLIFEDQHEAVADVVVGADGFHSIVRRFLFPDHKLRFTGNTAYRVLVPKSRLNHLPEITSTTGWWWGEDGHVYFSDVDDESEYEDPHFEITVRAYQEPEVPGKTVFWGISATNEKVAARVEKFDQRVRDAVDSVPAGAWREFATFAGPRLDKLIGWDRVVLIGDASHPLSGAFGSGATFAMEDGWILARAIEHTQPSQDFARVALEIFDEIRSPYYTRMYKNLDNARDNVARFQEKNVEFDNVLRFKIENFLYGDTDFIYNNNIKKTWEDYVVSRQRGEQ